MTAPAHTLDFRDLPRGAQDALVGNLAVAMGAPAALLVTVVRRARGRRGVQLGPLLVSLAHASATPSLGRWALHRGDRAGVVVALSLGAGTLVTPAVAARWSWTVVGRGNPLWAEGVGALVRMAGSLAAILPVARWIRQGRLSGG